MGVNFTPKTASRLLKMSRGVAPASLRSQEFQETRQPIYFQNDEPEEIPPFGCMKVTGATEVNGRAFVVVAKPDGDGGPFLFNNWRTVPASGSDNPRGVAYTGVVKVAYSSGTPAAGEMWGVDSDSWLLTSDGTDSAVMVYGSIKDEPGDKVLLGNTTSASTQVLKIGKTDAVIAAGASGTVSVWRSAADTGENVTAHHDWITESTQISSGQEVLMGWFADESKWRIIDRECE